MNDQKVGLIDYRCCNCGKLFFKGELEKCTIEIKCKHCKTINRLDFDCANGKMLLKLASQLSLEKNNLSK